MDCSSSIPSSFDSYHMVIAMGGDGTINRLIQTLPSTIPLGLIPFGSANVLAKSLGIPLSIKKAVDVILQRKTRSIDLGQLGHYRFCCMAGVGFDVDVIQRTDRFLKKILGRLGYVIAGLYTLLLYRPERIEIRDSITQKCYVGYFAIIANTPLYGGKFLLSETCSDDDGILDVFLLKKPSRLSLVCGFIYLGLSRLEQCKAFERISIQSCEIITRTQAFHVDAERVEGPVSELCILPQALCVIVPDVQK